MLLPVLSLAVSGAAAAAAASVVAERVFGPAKRKRSSSSSSPSSPSSPPSTSSRSSRSLISAADGFLFFFVYGYIVRHQQRSPTATPTTLGFNEFLASTAAAACTHIFSAATAFDGAASLFASRRGSAAEDLALALDPGIAFCLQQVLGYAAQQTSWMQRLRYGSDRFSGRPRHQRGRAEQAARLLARAALDTTVVFVLAATSKAVSTTLTYPLLTAGRLREERKAAEATTTIETVIKAEMIETVGTVEMIETVEAVETVETAETNKESRLPGTRTDVEIQMASIAKDAADVARAAAGGAPAVDTPPDSPKAEAFTGDGLTATPAATPTTTLTVTPTITTTTTAATKAAAVATVKASSCPPTPKPRPRQRLPLALFAGLPNVMVRAALCHGLTMAGQRVLYSIVLRMVYAVAGALARLLQGRRSREAKKEAKRKPTWASSYETERTYNKEVAYGNEAETYRAIENTVDAARPERLERREQPEQQLLLSPPPVSEEELQQALAQVQTAKESPKDVLALVKPSQTPLKPMEPMELMEPMVPLKQLESLETLAAPSQTSLQTDIVRLEEPEATLLPKAAVTPSGPLLVEAPIVAAPVQSVQSGLPVQPIQQPAQLPVQLPIQLPIQQNQLPPLLSARELEPLKADPVSALTESRPPVLAEDRPSFSLDLSQKPQGLPSLPKGLPSSPQDFSRQDGRLPKAVVPAYRQETIPATKPEHPRSDIVSAPTKALELRPKALQISPTAKRSIPSPPPPPTPPASVPSINRIDRSLQEDVADRLRSWSVHEDFYGYGNEEEEEGTIIYNMISRTQRVVW